MKTTKWILILFCTALLACCACQQTPPVTDPTPTATPTEVPTETPVPTKKPLTINDKLTGLDAFGITDLMTVGWNLGNVLDSHGPGITYDSTPGKAAKFWGNEEPTWAVFRAVKLAGYSYGFIGGASGVVDNKVYFFGDIKKHPDCDAICDAITNEGFIPVSLSDEPLRDLGGIISL